MDLKKTILVVKPSLDAMRTAKEELIRDEDRKRQLVKYSDNAVETKTKLFIFKTVIVPRNILDQIRGYAEVQADEFMTDFYKFVKEVEIVCNYAAKAIPNTPSEATGSPRGAKVDDDIDAPNGEKNSSEQE